MKVAVIGVGSMGKNHARVYSELKGVELAAVVDRDEKTGREVAKRFGAEYYPDYKGILGKVDAASVVVPTRLHHMVGKDFLKSGVDVLMEKPITTTLEEADELIKLARENSRILQVGHIERFNPAVMQLKDYVKRDEIIGLEAHRVGPSGARITDAGVVLDLMIHDIDIALSLVGGEVEGVSAEGRKVSGAHEDYAVAVIRFKSGAIATLTASRATQKRERTLSVTEKGKYLVVDYMNKAIEVHRQAKSEYVTEGGASRLVYSDVVERPQIPQPEPLKLELESFVDCVKKRGKPVVDGVAGRNALEIALRVLKEVG